MIGGIVKRDNGVILQTFSTLPVAAPRGKLVYKIPENRVYVGDGTVWSLVGVTSEALAFEVACNPVVVPFEWLYMDSGTGLAELACAAQGVSRTPPAEYICLSKPAPGIALVVPEGEIKYTPGGLTPGALYYLDIVPGQMTAVVPTWALGFDYQQVLGGASDLVDEYNVDTHSQPEGLAP